MSRWSGSVAGRFKFVWISLNFNRVFLLVKFSNVFESLPKLMSFDLHSSFRTLVCSLYQVRDSDKCFADSTLNDFSSALILSTISFFSSEIIVSSGLGICIASTSLAVQHCVKSAQIRSFFWSVFSCILTEYRKIRARKNSVFGTLFTQCVLEVVTIVVLTLWQLCFWMHYIYLIYIQIVMKLF